MKDSETGSFNSLAKNIIFMANGQTRRSFLSLIGVKKSYTMKDYQYSDPFHVSGDYRNSIFTTLRCFSTLANKHFSDLDSIGHVFGSVFGEISTREN